MNWRPSSFISSTWGKPVKVLSCVLFFLAAFGNAFFSIEYAINHGDDIWRSIVVLVLGLSFSGLMFLFLYAALKTHTQEFVISTRLLFRHGFQRMKAMSSDEYERLANLERSIDAEIATRTKQKNDSA